MPCLQQGVTNKLNSPSTNDDDVKTQTTNSMREGRVLKKNPLPMANRKLRRILAKIIEGNFPVITPTHKNTSGKRRNSSGRRSKYIGVSKNNQNWQVLITVANSKKYIGTFLTEKEAAIAYDFYSIALHGAKATTNF